MRDHNAVLTAAVAALVRARDEQGAGSDALARVADAVTAQLR